MRTDYLTLPLQVKALNDREIEGHGSVFGNVDLGRDIVVPGAFKRSLAEHRKNGTMPQMFWMHQPDQVPGAWTKVEEDDDGLLVRGVLAKTQLGDETRELVKMKAVRGLSIGYRTLDSDWDDDGNRLLKELDLWEVSVVSLAMNPLARIESAKCRLSADGEYVPTKREFERELRRIGCSKSIARVLISRLFADPDPGVMPDDRRRDAVIDSEEKAALRALADLADELYASAIPSIT